MRVAALIALALSALSSSAQAYDPYNTCPDCSPMPVVEVRPIDRDEWIPWEDRDPFPDVGFDSNESAYGSDGYWPEDQRVECSAWLVQPGNQPPDGCSATVAPPAVTPSDPPCGPDGSLVSQLLPQNFASACVAHDVCYSQLDADKARCDTSFRANMYSTCDTELMAEAGGVCRTVRMRNGVYVCASDDIGFQACLTEADAFYAGVNWSWAQDRFTALNAQAQCRQWHQRKQNESTCP